LNKKIAVYASAGVVIAAVLTALIVGVLSRSSTQNEGRDEHSKGELETGIKDPRGRDLPRPNPENTVVPPQDIQPLGEEPIFIPKNEMPPQALPPDATAIIKTTGGIRETEPSKAVVICSPMPTNEYWVEIEDAKLGDRTWRSNFKIDNFHGDGTYEVPVGMAMRYPDGQLFPYADGKSIVEISGGGTKGTIRAEMYFLEGLTSVSLAYRCGGAGSP